MIDLSGKVALVTGASRGVGSGIAKVLAACGADVVVNFYTSADKAKEITESIQATGKRAIAVQANVSSPEEVELMVQMVNDKFGQVDILVNNAGHNWIKPILDITVEDWDRTINLNLRSHFLTSKAVLPGMVERGWGRIIGISSISGQRGGLSGDVDYSAAKAGILGFTRCLARHVADNGITVNAVALGYIWTEGLEAVPKDKRDRILNQIPALRYGTIDECGAIVAFLASEEAAYITGETITVNGGVHIA
jgi:NAD(P)-dependent dehydrogenase (short-subunit alcohol dehydrogenase family)